VNGTLRHWLKFNAVGLIGVGVQLFTLTILTSGLGLNYLAATFLAVESAVLHNFIWHERWTWRERTRVSPSDIIVRLVQFNLTTGAVSILGNLIFMWLLVGQARLHYFVANILTIAACGLINFVVSDQVVFRLKRLHRPHR